MSKDGDIKDEKSGGGQEDTEETVESVEKEGMEAPPTGHETAAAREESPQPGDTTIVPGDSPNDTEAVTPALDIAPPTSSSADKEEALRRGVIGDHSHVNGASLPRPQDHFPYHSQRSNRRPQPHTLFHLSHHPSKAPTQTLRDCASHLLSPHPGVFAFGLHH